MNYDLEKVSVIVTNETDKAFQFKERDGEERQEWFPKSHVSFSQRNIKTGMAVAEIPFWLLKEKGWDA